MESTKNNDCYFYYYSFCEKSASCPYRHESAALKNERICSFWRSGRCETTHCSFRHMNIKKDRTKIPCYHEQQPGGCKKPHCPFSHTSDHASKNSQFKESYVKTTDDGKLRNSRHRSASDSVSVRNAADVAKFADDHSLSHGGSSNLFLNLVKPTSHKQYTKSYGRGGQTGNDSSSYQIQVKSDHIRLPGVRPLVTLKPEVWCLENVNKLISKIVSCIMNFPNLKAPLYHVTSASKCNTEELKTVVRENSRIFLIDGKSLSLRLPVKICQDYLKNSCRGLLYCTSLHICEDFVYRSCGQEDCIKGHFWHTQHNKNVLSSFNLNEVSAKNLSILFKKSNFSSFTQSFEHIKVCDEYNANHCTNTDCTGIHICINFLANICSSNCSLNHKYTELGVRKILEKCEISLNEAPMDIIQSICLMPEIRKQLKSIIKAGNAANDTVNIGIKPNFSTKIENKTRWHFELNGDVQCAEICFNSVESFCKKEDIACPRLHAYCHFYWQVKNSASRDFWMNLTEEQCFDLERQYCDPNNDEAKLKPLDLSNQQIHRDLLVVLKGKSEWEANFEKMTLKIACSSGEDEYISLRRLASEDATKSSHVVPDAGIFNWYFLDINKIWVLYGEPDTAQDKHQCDSNSSKIENFYKANPSTKFKFKSSKCAYELDFSKMQQTNLETKVTRSVKRRPKPHLKSDAASEISKFPATWEDMKDTEHLKRVVVSSSSQEYKEIETLYLASRPKSNIIKIERIQNRFHYEIFQKKVEEMTARYNDAKVTDIKRLFHGTNTDVATKICNENFDWRLHGTNVGQIYGRGSYFSPSSNTSYSYTQPDQNGHRYIFVAQVAVGTVTNGNSTMSRPPIHPRYNVPCDSTVDKIHTPNIIVKYDKAEHYPEYLLTIDK